MTGACVWVCVYENYCHPIGDGGLVDKGEVAFGVDYYVYVMTAYHFAKYLGVELLFIARNTPVHY